MAAVNAGVSAGVSSSGSGVEFDQMATLIIGDNKIELDVSFFAQLQQSRDPLSQLLGQAVEGVNSINSAASGWWHGKSYGTASDLLSGIASGDEASLSKFADQLGLQNSQNQQLSQLIGQAKDDMHRIVLNAYDQIGQLGVSGTSSTGGLGPKAMSVVNNGRKAVDDLIIQLLGQIRNMHDSNQDAASRFQSGKKDAKADGEANASPGGQGQGVQIDQTQTKHNADGSTTVTGKDKDGNVTYTTTHKDGSVDTTVTSKDKDGNVTYTTTHKDGSVDTTVTSKDKDGNPVATTTHQNGSSDTLVATKDKDGNVTSKTTQANGGKTENVYGAKDKKDTTTQADGGKTTTQTKPDGTQESKHEPPQDAQDAGAGRGNGDTPAPGRADGHEQPGDGGSPSQSGLISTPSGPSDGGFHGGGNGGFHGGGGDGGFHGGGGGNQGGNPGNQGNNGAWGGGHEPSQQQNPQQQDNRNNPVSSPTPSNSEHTANPTGAIGDTRTGPVGPMATTGLQGGAPATSPQSSSPATSTSGGPSNAESRQTSSPSQSGGAQGGAPASPQGPLGQGANPAGPLGNLANAAAQAASPLGNLANAATGVGSNIANLAGAPGSLSQPPTPTAPSAAGTGTGSGFSGSDYKPAPGNATPASFGGGSGGSGGAAPPHQPPLQQAPPTGVPTPPPPPNTGQTPPAEGPAGQGGAPTSPMGGAYPMSPYAGGPAAAAGGRHSRGGLGPWQADPNYTGPNVIDPLGNSHPNQDAIDTIVRLLRLVLDSDRVARENYPPGVRPAYAIAAHADPDEIVHYFFFTNQGRGWTPPGVVVPRATQLGWETVPPAGRGGILGRSDPGLQALRHFEAVSQEYIASGKRYRLIAVATSMEVRDELNTAILQANDKIVGDVAIAAEPRFVDPATSSGGQAAESATVLLHRLEAVAPDAHRRISALLAEKADVSSLAMELAVDTVEASFAYDRPAFLEVVGALKRGEPITENMVEALREDIVAAVGSAEIERSQQEAKPPADQKMVKYASDHTRISAGVALLALLEGDDDSVLDIAYEHYATNARPDKISGLIDQLAPSQKPAL
ncbi:MAG: hypothetical protein ACRC20_14795 [Segniliparus sp.]|uniref:hypothetical protein n=1 Tax=Segniliparus sp. TaxID=2804064 RepID=UPI003F2DF308